METRSNRLLQRALIAIAFACCIPGLAGAQLLRANDALRAAEEIECTGSAPFLHSPAEVVPSGLIRSISAEAEGMRATRADPTHVAGEGLAHVRLRLAPTQACPNDWNITADVRGGSQSAGAALEAGLPLAYFGNPDTNTVWVSRLYAGISTERVRYDPVIGFSREYWGGLALRPPDIETAIAVPGTDKRAIVRIRTRFSLQGDRSWDHDILAARQRAWLPHYAWSFPIKANFIGLMGLIPAYERVVDFSGTTDVRRRSISLFYDGGETARWRCGLRWFDERAGHRQSYSELGLILQLKALDL